MRREDLRDIALFLQEYSTRLMGSGVHTARVARNTRRIAQALNVDAKVVLLHKTIIISVEDLENHQSINEVAVVPELPISFRLNSELSSLSWAAQDEKLNLEEIKSRYNDIVSQPRLDFRLIWLLLSVANGCFCALFGGDIWACIMVSMATAVGFYLRTILNRSGVNAFLSVIISAIAASLVSALSLTFDATADIAIGTSVLFMVPGVPIINGIIDVVSGHTVAGSGRLIQAALIVICIAVGLSATLLIFENKLI